MIQYFLESGDRALHFMSSCGMFFLIYPQLKHWVFTLLSHNYNMMISILMAAVISALIGISYEMLQDTGVFPNSAFCWDDVAANLYGIAFGVFICFILEIRI
jgi:hypothetical protein|tara:strand:+ start:531 stop:836 length:306 start_codon:yes stop_codon:yes gene_type:complete